MTHLIENIIAIEVPNDAINPIWVGRKVSQDKYLFWMSPNGIDSKTLGAGSYSLIGITPLSEEQWVDIVGIDYNEDVFPTFNEFLIYFLSHKGLSPDKKYAIIKIEKK